VIVEDGMFRQESHGDSSGSIARGTIEHQDTAGRGPNQSGDEFEGCRLACAVRSQQSKDFARRQLERHVVKGTVPTPAEEARRKVFRQTF